MNETAPHTWCALEEAAKAVQLDTDSSWQNVSPYKEGEFELLQEVRDQRFDGSSMRRAFKVEKLGDWADFLKTRHAQSMDKCDSARMLQ